MAVAEVRQVQKHDHHAQGDQADRHVDQEDPTPAGDAQNGVGAGEHASDQGADDGGDAEGGHEVALVLGPLAGGEHVADDGQRQRHQATGAQALDGAETGQHQHGGREAGQERSEDEHADADQEQRASSENVGQLAVQRCGDGGRDQVSGGDPSLLIQAIEIVADGANRGTDDRLVQRRQEHAGHQTVDDEPDLPLRHQGCGCWWGRFRASFRDCCCHQNPPDILNAAQCSGAYLQYCNFAGMQKSGRNCVAA